MGAPQGLARMTGNLHLNMDFLENFKNDLSQHAVKNVLILLRTPCSYNSAPYTVLGKYTMLVFAGKGNHIQAMTFGNLD